MFIAYLFFCETVNTGCDMLIMYEPLISRNGTVEALIYAPIMLASDPTIAVMVSLPVQLFIAWRVKVLNQSIVLPIIIAIFSIASFVGGIATAVFITIIREYANFPKAELWSLIWLVTSAVADIFITGVLVFSLLRRRTGIGATDHLLNRLIRLTIQTGLITAAFAILNFALFMSLRGTWNFIFDFPLSKLYSNSLLSTLNARCGWKPSTTVQDNALFGSHPAVGLESVSRGRTQVRLAITLCGLDLTRAALDRDPEQQQSSNESTFETGLYEGF
ncbi:hypothetical protein JVU11DRAFT_7108 [Chiua virens]|nr:hypothetical protein JVU11DRAFT_7108 [Chiua virens]